MPSAISPVCWIERGGDGGDPDGHVLAHGLVAEQAESALKGVDVALVLEALAAEQHLDDLGVLADAAQGPVEFDAVEAFDDEVAGGAESADHASPGDGFEGGELLGDRSGGAGEGIEDAGADLQLLGVGGDHGEPGQDGVSPGFAGGDHFVAEVFGDLDLLEGVSPVGVESGQDA